MIALVTYPYRDRETLAVHLVGEEVELTEARFAELSAGGYVDLPPVAPATAEPVEDEPAEEEGGEDAESEQPAKGGAAPEMTVQQLREAIESAGGFAPRKATKAELAAILETL